MLLNLDFINNTILLCFTFFIITIDLYFLTSEVIAQIFNATAKLVVPIGIPSKEAKAAIEIYSVLVAAKIRKCSVLSTHQLILPYFFKEIISCFIYIFKSKLLTYVSFSYIAKVIIYSQ